MKINECTQRLNDEIKLLEDNILDLIQKFEEKTGLYVVDIRPVSGYDTRDRVPSVDLIKVKVSFP